MKNKTQKPRLKLFYRFTAWFLIFVILGAILVTIPPYKTAKAVFSGLKPGATEIVSKRNANTKVFDNHDGTEQYVASSGLLHYQDGNSWKDIDTTIQPNGDNYEMNKSIYKAQFKKDFQSDKIVHLEKDGYGISVIPGDLLYTSEEESQLISIPQESQGSATGNKITYPNAYGAGLDFSYETNDINLMKKLTVPSLESLPAPNENILNDQDPQIALNLGFELDKEMDIYIGGKLWNRDEIEVNNQYIEFQKDGKTIWKFASPKAWDSSSSIISGTTTLAKTGNNLNLVLTFPYSFLKTAQYPVTIDPPVDYPGETTDGWIEGFSGSRSGSYATARATSTSLNNTGSSFKVGQYGSAGWTIYRGYVEFDTSGIDDAATVTQANLYLTAIADVSATNNFTVRVHEYAWTSPIASGNRETNYDGALAATANAVDWKNTADGDFAVNTSFSSSNIRTDYIQKGATKTKFSLVSNRDVAAIDPGAVNGFEYIELASQENATQAYRPYLSITVEAGVPTLTGVLFLLLVGCGVFIAIKTGAIKIKMPKGPEDKPRK